MMIYGKIENGIVVATLETSGAAPDGYIVVPSHAVAGNTYANGVFTPPVVPTPPISVTPRQFRQALTRVGLRSAVEAAIAASDRDTKDWYEFASSFERNHPTTIAVTVALGKTEADLDALFTLAATL